MAVSKILTKDLLIVDDDKSICEIMKEYAINMGCFRNIVFAHDGILATQKLRNQKFAVIMLDINMPKKDGIDLLKEFEPGAINAKSSVVVASGTLDKEVIGHIIHAGVKNFLVKPFDEGQFQERVLKVLSQSN